jgi:hypothetical protein
MKGLAGIGATLCIAGAIALWFMTRPALVVIERQPLTASSALPTFHRVGDDPQASQKTR